MRKDGNIYVVIGKKLAVLPKPELLEPVCNLLHGSLHATFSAPVLACIICWSCEGVQGSVGVLRASQRHAAAAETQITIESLIKEAADIQKRATKAGQHSAAIAALIAKAKLAGRWVDRAEQRNTNVVYAVSDRPMSEEDGSAIRHGGLSRRAIRRYHPQERRNVISLARGTALRYSPPACASSDRRAPSDLPGVELACDRDTYRNPPLGSLGSPAIR